jgi:hypothetical protein
MTTRSNVQIVRPYSNTNYIEIVRSSSDGQTVSRIINKRNISEIRMTFSNDDYDQPVLIKIVMKHNRATEVIPYPRSEIEEARSFLLRLACLADV